MFKRIILTLFVFLISTAGWAENSCPNLSGIYHCPKQVSYTATTIEIKQKFSPWFRTDIFDIFRRADGKKVVTHNFVADAQPRTYRSNIAIYMFLRGISKGTYVESNRRTTVSCIDSDTLKIVSDDKWTSYKFFNVMTYSKDENDNLHISYEWRTQGKDGNEDSGSTKRSCRRIP